MQESIEILNVIINTLRALIITAIALGFIAGSLLLISRKAFTNISSILNMWISTDKIEKVISACRDIDQFILEKNKVFGVLFIFLSLAIFYLLKQF